MLLLVLGCDGPDALPPGDVSPVYTSATCPSAACISHQPPGIVAGDSPVDSDPSIDTAVPEDTGWNLGDDLLQAPGSSVEEGWTEPVLELEGSVDDVVAIDLDGDGMDEPIWSQQEWFDHQDGQKPSPKCVNPRKSEGLAEKWWRRRHPDPGVVITGI
ncbi:MAG TPA: hypothetical protein QGF58_10025 [Myxococcota bacterium]|jgi:hypothetical protein|nr:hypothetical protein [Myxococcota bacterium]